MTKDETDIQTLNTFIKETNQQYQDIIRRIYEIIKSQEIKYDIAIKWKRLTFTIDEDFHHWICALDITKNSINLVFHFGGLLNDDNNIFKLGTSKFLRKIEYKTLKDIEEKTINDFLNQAFTKVQYFKENWKELNNKN